ncbi:undecaprenyl diphosphate synthase family protein [Streptomyces tricolor]|nr:undecaprenyl diphosphate synthase family protein [Streptomyces tricolor]
MDGNGRWAARRSLPRLSGHWRGGDDGDRCHLARTAGVEWLSLHAFSTENGSGRAPRSTSWMRLVRRVVQTPPAVTARGSAAGSSAWRSRNPAGADPGLR